MACTRVVKRRARHAKDGGAQKDYEYAKVCPSRCCVTGQLVGVKNDTQSEEENCAYQMTMNVDWVTSVRG